MQGLIGRYLTETVKTRLQNNPAVAILGPRQCGKTTLAGQIVKNMAKSERKNFLITLALRLHDVFT